MKILLFTSNTKGGIIQFSMTLLKNLKELGHEVLCLIPENAEYNINSKYEDCIEKYEIVNYKFNSKNLILKNFDYDKKVKKIANKINNLNYDFVWLLDNPFLSCRVALKISKKIKLVLTLHDSNVGHPENGDFIFLLKKKYEKRLSKKVEKRANKILFLSNNSLNLYQNESKKLISKTCFLRLGAHIPDVHEMKPINFDERQYHLFFGRIDKYKGLLTLLKAYNSSNAFKYKLIIAGSGKFSEEEKNEIQKNDNIIIINRFIEDSEMIWLIKNANSIILPYIQATQSGIIPIAYNFGVPVIVSNVEGLTQDVIDGNTGFICNNQDDYIKSMLSLENLNIRNELSKKAKKYNNENFDWKINLIKMISNLNFYHR